MTVLEIVLLGTALVTCSGLAAYGVLALRSHRAAQMRIGCDPSDRDLTVHTRETPAEPECTSKSRTGSGLRAGPDATSRPMDAWVDDTLWHKLDDL